MDDLDRQLNTLLSKTGWMDSKQLYDLLDSGVGATPAASIKHIVISYPGIGIGGGVERVIVLLSELLIGAGYAITVATDGTAENEYELPKGVKRLILPNKRLAKLETMRTYIRDNNVDLWLFNAYWLEETRYCMAFVKLLGCRAVLTLHVSFFMAMHTGKASLYAESIPAFNRVDAVTCLTYSDYLWWRSAGCNVAVNITNPLTFDPDAVTRTEGKNKDVVFVARLSQTHGQDKGTYLLPDLIQLVANKVEDVTFTLLGEFDTEAERQLFHSMLVERGVETHVKMPGRVSNVSSYLQNSSVLIIPSNIEGCPMVRREAFAHGVPLVYFDMGYLEPSGPEYGSIMVGKRDVPGMADAVTRLLTDRDYWLEVSHNAPKALEGLSGDMIVAYWKSLFSSIVSGSVHYDYLPPEQVDFRYLASTIRESVSANQALAERYHYLDSVDRKLNKFFPKSSPCRDFMDKWAGRIQKYAERRRLMRRRRRQ